MFNPVERMAGFLVTRQRAGVHRAACAGFGGSQSFAAAQFVMPDYFIAETNDPRSRAVINIQGNHLGGRIRLFKF